MDDNLYEHVMFIYVYNVRVCVCCVLNTTLDDVQ